MKKYKSEGMKKYKIEATLTYGMKFSAWFMALMTGIMLLSVTFIPLLVFYAMQTNDYRMLLAFLLPVLGILAWAYIAFLDRKQNREIKKMVGGRRTADGSGNGNRQDRKQRNARHADKSRADLYL